ncbi:MAG: exodeoxyribonuclease VII large subunit [Gracilibacter sp. BRH_c7a]|nr:MAG: exodeoxyribonuclease VII large subunit [Gracilibacter sp. BRH_c7a]
MPPKVFTVSEINSEISNALKKPNLLNCWITGEISNYKNHIPSGHWYFTLKDQNAALRGVMFRTQTVNVAFKPQNGMKVIVRGSIRLYQKDGSIQIYAEEIHPSGLGALYLAFEQLKQSLAQEGLFLPEKKRPIPKYPARVAIVTSPTGAALKDILNVAQRRNPCVSLIVIPSAVQGEAAPKEIAQGIVMANRYGNIDLIIVGRGGGSLEELWAFNTEEVARAIASSNIPVVSAVGHEIDYTISDLVADLRAPTPSAAAELVIPILADLKAGVHYLEDRLSLQIRTILEKKKRKVEELRSSSVLARPTWRLEQSRQELDSVSGRLQEGITGFINDRSGILKLASAKLDLLSPLQTLSRGYSLAYDSQGKVIRSVGQVKKKEELRLRIRDGTVECEVRNVSTD